MGGNTTAPVPEPCRYDNGDVAWVMAATVLVLGMIPGLAFFESGMLRKKNSVSIITQTMGGLVILACLWIVIGYSLTFGRDIHGMIGSLDYALFLNVAYDDCVVADGIQYRIPSAAYAIFQMMFACVTPLLTTGAVAERMRFKAFLLFMLGFEVLVYHPAYRIMGYIVMACIVMACIVMAYKVMACIVMASRATVGRTASRSRLALPPPRPI